MDKQPIECVREDGEMVIELMRLAHSLPEAPGMPSRSRAVECLKQATLQMMILSQIGESVTVDQHCARLQSHIKEFIASKVS